MRNKAWRFFLIVVLALSLVSAVPPATSGAFPFTTVYITRYRSPFYHRHKCVALTHGATAISVSNAKERGFRRCPNCKPPAW